MSQIVIFNVRDFTLVLLRCMLLMLKVYYWKQNKNLLSMIWCVCEMSTNNFHVTKFQCSIRFLIINRRKTLPSAFFVKFHSSFRRESS